MDSLENLFSVIPFLNGLNWNFFLVVLKSMRREKCMINCEIVPPFVICVL